MVVAAKTRVLDVLLIEGTPGAGLSLEALRHCATDVDLRVARNGAEALALIRRKGANSGAPRPAIILLDLPGEGALKLLAEIKNDPDYRRIPVVVFSAAPAADEIQAAYGLHANCYLPKPADAAQLAAVVRCIEEFWLTRVRLPAA